MLGYLAVGRLERLINIWIEELTEEEMRILADETASSISCYTAHVHALQTFIKKVTVFRAAAPYVDKDLEPKKSVGEDTGARMYKLSVLYDRYFEYADFLATQGLVKHAVAFLKLTSRGYKGAQGTQLEFTAGRERLLIAAGVSKETPATSSRTEVSALATAPTALAAPSTVTTSTTTSTSAYPYNPYAAAAQQHAPSHAAAVPLVPTSYSYAPTNIMFLLLQTTLTLLSSRPSTVSAKCTNNDVSVRKCIPFGGPRATPPPVAPPPPPKRRENGGWNDAPAVAERRTSSRSANKPVAVTSPFPSAGPARGPVSNSMYSAPRGQSPFQFLRPHDLVVYSHVPLRHRTVATDPTSAHGRCSWAISTGRLRLCSSTNASTKCNSCRAAAATSRPVCTSTAWSCYPTTGA